MSLSFDQFLNQVMESGLVSAGEIAALLDTLPEERRPRDGEQLARELVMQKRLTKFQADQIFAGKGTSLVLGNYVVLEKLGQGGMGIVYKAKHRRMDRIVALKVLSPRILSRPELAQRFEREVQAAAKLTHSNVVKALDAELDGTRRFLVMEYVEGVDLLLLIRRCGKLPIRWAIDFVRQAALGLDYAHHQGIVHRDIKPSNLLRDRSGTIKILDLGLARMMVADGAADLTSTGEVVGTVDYMAPEQAANTKNVDARADIYSLGITLWYLLTGRLAYEGDSAMAKLLAHSESPIPSLLDARPDVPADLERIFQKMVAKQPDQRYSTMADVAADLERCLASAPTTVDEPAELVAALDESMAETGDSTIAYQFPVDDKETMPYVATKDLWAEVSGDANRLQNYGQRLIKWSWLVTALTVAVVVIEWKADPFGHWRDVPDRGQAPQNSKLAEEIGGGQQNLNPPILNSAVPDPSLAPVASSKPVEPKAPPQVAKVEPPRETVEQARGRVAALTAMLESKPDDIGLLQERNAWYRRLGMWREASADLEVLADQSQFVDQSTLRMQVSYVAVLGNDLDRYRRTCRRLIEQFGQTNSIEDLERACKAPLFVAGEFKISDLPLKRFEELIKPDEPDRGPTYWACTTRAYIACREGEPAAALDWIAKRPVGDYAVHLFTYQCLVKAQAYHQLGRADEARAAFQEAVSMIPAELLRSLEGPPDPNLLLAVESTHGDWLIAALLKRQTESLLKSQQAE